jgi:hypothetical protein
MGTQPDELKTEVEHTRAHLARNVDLLAEKVTPSKVARRKADAAHNRLAGIKERVMGSANNTRNDVQGSAHGAADAASRTTEQTRETVRRRAGQVSDTVQQTPDLVKERTQGSPVAAGIIAFGAGMLAAALLPPTAAEQRVGEKVRAHSDGLLQPMKETAQGVAQDLKDDLSGPASDAADSLKSTAHGAVRATKEQAQESGQGAAEGLRDVGQEAAREAREQSGGQTSR